MLSRYYALICYRKRSCYATRWSIENTIRVNTGNFILLNHAVKCASRGTQRPMMHSWFIASQLHTICSLRSLVRRRRRMAYWLWVSDTQMGTFYPSNCALLKLLIMPQYGGSFIMQRRRTEWKQIPDCDDENDVRLSDTFLALSGVWPVVRPNMFLCESSMLQEKNMSPEGINSKIRAKWHWHPGGVWAERSNWLEQKKTYT